MIGKFWCCCVVLAALTGLPGWVWACSVSADGLAFGSYSPFDAGHADSTATITVDCETAYTLKLSEGFSGSFSPREMAGDGDPADRLDYNIYTDASFSVVWGDDSGASQSVAGAGSSQPVDHTAHGRIPAGQNARVGTYSDVITVTVEF